MQERNGVGSRQRPNLIEPLDEPYRVHINRRRPHVISSGMRRTTQSRKSDSPWVILMTLRAKISADMEACDDPLASYLQLEILPELDQIKALMDQHDNKLRQALALFIT